MSANCLSYKRWTKDCLGEVEMLHLYTEHVVQTIFLYYLTGIIFEEHLNNGTNTVRVVKDIY